MSEKHSKAYILGHFISISAVVFVCSFIVGTFIYTMRREFPPIEEETLTLSEVIALVDAHRKNTESYPTIIQMYREDLSECDTVVEDWQKLAMSCIDATGYIVPVEEFTKLRKDLEATYTP